MAFAARLCHTPATNNHLQVSIGWLMLLTRSQNAILHQRQQVTGTEHPFNIPVGGFLLCKHHWSITLRERKSSGDCSMRTFGYVVCLSGPRRLSRSVVGTETCPNNFGCGTSVVPVQSNLISRTSMMLRTSTVALTHVACIVTLRSGSNTLLWRSFFLPCPCTFPASVQTKGCAKCEVFKHVTDNFYRHIFLLVDILYFNFTF